MSEAEFAVTAEAEGPILRVTLTGEATDGNAGAIAAEVIAAVRRHGLTRTLVDVRGLIGRLGAVETFLHVREYPSGTPQRPTVVVDRVEHAAYAAGPTAFRSNVCYRRSSGIACG